MKLTLVLAVILVLLVWHVATSRCEKYDADEEQEDSGIRKYGYGFPDITPTYGRNVANLFYMS